MSRDVPLTSHDVIVVGARCAGAATALLLARAGHDVLVVDRATFPSDVLSTHAIARSGVVQLRRWGLLDRVLASGAPPIRTVEFHQGGQVVARTLKERHGVDALVAPRRTVLDALLVDAAVEAGATLRTGISVKGVTRDRTGRVDGIVGRDLRGPVAARARLVVGADGLRSRIARTVGAPRVHVGPDDGSTHYAYVAGDWAAMEYHLGERAFGGVFPTHGGEACIWVCTPSPVALGARHRARTVDGAFAALVRDLVPSLAARLVGTEQRSAARGAVALPNQVRVAAGRGWALVGDAAYHRDPITGHGISDAFRDADLLAEAVDGILRGDAETPVLAAYEARRRAALAPFLDVTEEMIAFPGPDRFRELQVRLSDLIEQEAAWLSGRSAPDRTAA